MPEYASLVIMVLLTSAGQLLIKQGAVRVRYGHGLLDTLASALNTPVVLGTLAALLAPFFYIYALTRIPLSVAYAFTGLTFILILLGSHMLLKERVNAWHYLGIALIALGVVLAGAA